MESLADNIMLTVLSPEKMLLEQAVSKVSLPGTKGRFMVLKNHAPLISSLEAGDLIYMSSGVEGRIRISDGFVEIRENKVYVCAGS